MVWVWQQGRWGGGEWWVGEKNFRPLLLILLLTISSVFTFILLVTVKENYPGSRLQSFFFTLLEVFHSWSTQTSYWFLCILPWESVTSKSSKGKPLNGECWLQNNASKVFRNDAVTDVVCPVPHPRQNGRKILGLKGTNGQHKKR